MLLQKCGQGTGEHRGGSERGVMSELALEVGIFHKGSEEVHSKYRTGESAGLRNRRDDQYFAGAS